MKNAWEIKNVGILFSTLHFPLLPSTHTNFIYPHCGEWIKSTGLWILTEFTNFDAIA